MCGRYSIADEEDLMEIRQILHEVSQRYQNTSKLDQMKTGEIFPTNIAPILIHTDGETVPDIFKWGFPRWDGKGVIINARAETALEKPMFRESLLVRKCIIPTTGFYEWKSEEGTKTKYLFRIPNTSVLYLAGMFHGSEESFTILTTEANPSMSAYHNRMPVIIRHEELGDWLQNVDTSAFLNRIQPEVVGTLA